MSIKRKSIPRKVWLGPWRELRARLESLPDVEVVDISHTRGSRHIRLRGMLLGWDMPPASLVPVIGTSSFDRRPCLHLCISRQSFKGGGR